MNINDKSKVDFLTYANAVIKSRAISSVEDNQKPVHRRILWTLHELKLDSTKKTKKCANVIGAAMVYHPHGDTSIYDALIRLSQWWKMRYPLVYVQGNSGNIIGDSAAAMRYTECKLSKVGDLMLEDIDKNCVPFKPNYDESEKEPCYLPSKFPNLLCNGNSGIAVGISSSLLPHNYNEVASAIEYYLDHVDDCTVDDLLKFIKGPDFPTGGKIINGEILREAYTTGQGNFKLRSNYTIEKLTNGKTKLVFTDIPYMTELEGGIIQPLKKLVLEEGVDVFDDFYYEITNGRPQVYIILTKGADIPATLDMLFTKTKLATTIKMNNTVIVNGEPKIYNLKQMIASYVNHRSKVIGAIAQADLEKSAHKLTVVIGLQKCLSDIDTLISLIRNAANRDAAKTAIKAHFYLNDEQADAILDIKLSRLSKLDIAELQDDEKKLENEVAKFRDIVKNEATRYKIIRSQLEEMRGICGDDRLTTIDQDENSLPLEQLTNHNFFITPDGANDKGATASTIAVLKARSTAEMTFYNKDGEFMPESSAKDVIGAALVGSKKYFVTVTRNGNVKLTLQSEYNFKKKNKGIKLKEGDELVYAAEMGPQDSLMLFNGERVLKLPLSELNIAGKLTQGVKSGFDRIEKALVVSDNDYLLMVNKDNKGKITSVKDFTNESRGSKGQSVAENTRFIVLATGREEFYLVSKNKVTPLKADKVSLKGKDSIGAIISQKEIERII